MNKPIPLSTMVAVLPCNDIDASERFYQRLGFKRQGWQPRPGEPDSYRIYSNGLGAYLHLTAAVEGWLIKGRNPFALYLYLPNRADIDALAEAFRGEIVGKPEPEDKPWGMYELALSDPDDTLVRVGWEPRRGVDQE